MTNNNYDKKCYTVNKKMPHHVCEEWKRVTESLKRQYGERLSKIILVGKTKDKNNG